MSQDLGIWLKRFFWLSSFQFTISMQRLRQVSQSVLTLWRQQLPAQPGSTAHPAVTGDKSCSPSVPAFSGIWHAAHKCRSPLQAQKKPAGSRPSQETPTFPFSPDQEAPGDTTHQGVFPGSQVSACLSKRRKERGPRGHAGAVAGLGQVGFLQSCCFPDRATLCTPSTARSNVTPVVVPISGAALQLPEEASTSKLKVVRRHCYTHKTLLMPSFSSAVENQSQAEPSPISYLRWQPEGRGGSPVLTTTRMVEALSWCHWGQLG